MIELIIKTNTQEEMLIVIEPIRKFIGNKIRFIEMTEEKEEKDEVR